MSLGVHYRDLYVKAGNQDQQKLLTLETVEGKGCCGVHSGKKGAAAEFRV